MKEYKRLYKVTGRVIILCCLAMMILCGLTVQKIRKTEQRRAERSKEYTWNTGFIRNEDAN